MLIRSYGLFWRRDDVHWGWQKNAGHLKGRWVGSANSEPVDFRNQVGVYALYDDNYQLVYFGQAGRGAGHRLFNRLKDHKSDRIADRWTRFSWFGTRYVKKNNELSEEKSGFQGDATDVLDHIEAVVLAVAEPPHNRQGGRFGEKVQQFTQFRDEDNLGVDQITMISEIYRQIVLDSE